MDANEKKERAARRRAKRTEERRERHEARDAKARPARAAGTRKAITALESVGFLVIVLVVLVLANVASQYVFGRIDLTRNRIHSLSQGSERLVGSLEDRMTITAYFTEDLPEPWGSLEQYTRYILEEYEAASGGKLTVRFVNPDTDEEREQAEEDGIVAVPHQVIGRGSVNVREGYRGLVIRYLGEKESVPVIQEPRGLEYAISSAIRQLVRERIVVGVVGGHGSPELAQGLTKVQRALAQYELRSVSLGDEIDADETRALLIINPTEQFTDPELRRLNQYVMNGGSLGIFGGAMNVELGQMGVTGRPVNTGLNTLLEPWGVELEDGIVADANCGSVPYRHPIGIQIPTLFPPLPIIAFDEEAQEHPATYRLSSAPFFFPSPITTNNTFNRLHGRVLGRSGAEQSWLLTGDSIDLTPRDQSEWQVSGPLGPYNVLVALQGRLPSAFTTSGDSGIEAPARSRRDVQVLVTGSGFMLRDEVFPDPDQMQQGNPLNGAVALALNSVDWLTQDQDLIAIRAKNVEEPQIDVPRSMARPEADARREFERVRSGQVENEEELEAAQRRIRRHVERYNEALEEWETQKAWYQRGITLGVPLLVIIAGILRFVMRRNKRANLDALRAKLIRERVSEARAAREKD